MYTLNIIYYTFEKANNSRTKGMAKDKDPTDTIRVVANISYDANRILQALASLQSRPKQDLLSELLEAYAEKNRGRFEGLPGFDGEPIE